jgi:acyl carrier protein
MDGAPDLAQHTFESIRSWLLDAIATELETPPAAVAADVEFADLGLGSRQAIMITGDLEEFLGREELDPALLWDYPTIDKLARHLAGA